ncbi:MAG: Flp family type IVb pilin [Myxococcota bacterium]
MRPVLNFWSKEDGATAIEYAVLASFVVLAAMAGFVAFGNSANTLFTNISSHFAGTAP